MTTLELHFTSRQTNWMCIHTTYFFVCADILIARVPTSEMLPLSFPFGINKVSHCKNQYASFFLSSVTFLN
jgi:hypothetical protein